MLRENARCFYYGQGKSKVLLLHGGPGAAGSLSYLANILSKTIDIAELWQTSKNIDVMCAEISQQLQYCDDNPIIIGHSWGAVLGYIFAAKFPHNIGKLIMISSGALTKQHHEEAMVARFACISQENNSKMEILYKKLAASSGQEEVEIFCELAKFLETIEVSTPVDNIHERIKTLYYDLNCYKSINIEYKHLLNTNQMEALGTKIICPVSIIHGKNDPYSYTDLQNFLCKTLSTKTVFYLLDNCGHWPWREKYAEKEFFFIIQKEIGIECKDVNK